MRSFKTGGAVFLVSIIFCIWTTKCTKLYTENITEYLAHAQAVYIRPLLGGGGEGPGDEAGHETRWYGPTGSFL